MENNLEQACTNNYERVEFSDEGNSFVQTKTTTPNQLTKKLRKRNLKMLLFVSLISFTFGALISYGITSRSITQNFQSVKSPTIEDSSNVNISKTLTRIKQQRQNLRKLVDNPQRLDKYVADLTKVGSRAGMPSALHNLNYVDTFWSNLGYTTFNRTYKVPLSFIEDTSENVGVFICKSNQCQQRLPADTPITDFEKIDGLYPSIYIFSRRIEGNFSMLTIPDIKYLYDNYNNNEIKEIMKNKVVLITEKDVTKIDSNVKEITKSYSAGLLWQSTPAPFSKGNDVSYPEGTGFTNTSIQFSSTLRTRMKGDLTTLNYPSKPYAVRDQDFYNRSIPSENFYPKIPITTKDTNTLLKTFSTREVRMSSDAFLKINWPMKTKLRPIHVLCTQITGSVEPDRVILVGGHRDAWHAGALDPQSGMASLLEMSRIFKIMNNKGWTPHRTIMFCSWDGEEVALIGSNEWVEEEFRRLDYRLVAYFNTDTDIMGTWKIMVHAFPRMHDIINELFLENLHPNVSRHDGTPYHFFIDPDMYSDYYTFWHDIGVPTVDYSYTRGFKNEMTIYELYHTKYDTVKLYRMTDPGSKCHTNLVQNSAALIFTLVESPIIPVNLTKYATEIGLYRWSRLERYQDALFHFLNITEENQEPLMQVINIELPKTIQALTKFQSYLESLQNKQMSLLELRMINDKVIQAQKCFIYRSVFPVPEVMHLMHLQDLRGLLFNVTPPYYSPKNYYAKKYLESFILSLRSLTSILDNDFSV